MLIEKLRKLPAEIADFLISRENVNLSLAMGVHQKDMYLSLEALSKNVNVANFIRDIIQGIGTEGEHEIMAGGKIPDVSANSGMRVEGTITKRLLNTLSLSEVKKVRLIH